MFSSSDNDPLAAAIAPPKNESNAARVVRLRAEAEARRVSDEIDEQLKQDRAARRRQRPCVKVLLLGQSESGTFRASSCSGTSSFIITSCLSCFHA
jgi:guanine nucleotide-binding protein alpha-1 subunit